MFQRSGEQLDGRRRARPSRGVRAQEILGITVATVGTLILFGACLYRRLRHPDWTGGQALEAFWPLYIAGALSICIGWFLNDLDND